MHDDEKMLADAPTATTHRRMVVSAIAAVAMLLALGLAAQINGWMLAGMIAVAASGFAVMVWPPSRDERDAMAWWNGLTRSEREKWLAQGGTGQHRDAWEAYKRVKAAE